MKKKLFAINEYDVTPFLGRLKNKYVFWKWDREERKTKLYDPDSEFITYAHKNGFFYSPQHYIKWCSDFLTLGNIDFNKCFEMNVLGGILVPIKKELTE